MIIFLFCEFVYLRLPGPNIKVFCLSRNDLVRYRPARRLRDTAKLAAWKNDQLTSCEKQPSSHGFAKYSTA